MDNKRKIVDKENIDNENEAFMDIECKSDGTDIEISVNFQGNSEILVAGLVSSFMNDENMREILSLLSNNIQILRVSEETGKTPEEVFKEMVSREGDKPNNNEDGTIIPMGMGADA